MTRICARFCLLSLLWLMTAGGCRQSSPQPDARVATESSVLRIGLPTEPAHLVYMLRPDAWTFRLTANQLLEGLVRYDPRQRRYVGVLAERWDWSKDFSELTLHLRRGVRWHDGKLFSAEDVRFTFDRLYDQRVDAASTRAAIAPIVADYRSVDAHTFLIRCKQRSSFFLQALASLMILPKHAMSQGDLNRHPLLRRPLGTGRYRFAEWLPGRQISLERNERYWGQRASIRRVVWRIVRTPQLALQLARRGELDFVPRLQPAQVETLTGDGTLRRAFARVERLVPGTAFVVINTRRPLLARSIVRRALAHSLDVERIVQQIMQGQAERVPSLYWPGDPDFDPAIKPPTYDPQLAARLFDQAGWKLSAGKRRHRDQPIELSLMVPSVSRSALRWATLFQQSLAEQGIALEIRSLEWSTFLKRLQARDFDLAALGMQIAGVSTDLYLQLHSSQASDGQNYAGYRDQRVDRLLEAIRQLSGQQRKQAVAKLQRLLVEEMPLIPLFTLREIGALSRRFVAPTAESDAWYDIGRFRLRSAVR
ncbi:MAG: hypothetical protein H6707_16075 [Deltaproteobacteria bacterium]|nr:hypothetical protein [Deltaproteobacteria bacterium]